MISNSLKASIVAFNGSVNCDRSSPENFYESYNKRKKDMITSKVISMRKGELVNRTKLKRDIDYLREFTDKKVDVLSFLKYVLGISEEGEDGLISEAASLIPDLNLD